MKNEDAVLYQRGADAFARGEYAEAERCLAAVLVRHRDYADIYSMLGTIFHVKGQFTKALRLFARALEINPAYTEAKVNLMILLQDLGRYDRATQILRHIQRSSDALPQSPDPLSKNKLANLHAVTGDMYQMLDLYDAAVDQYEAALDLRPNFTDIRLKLARAFKAKGQLEFAETQTRACLKTRPDHNEARVFLGTLLMAQGRRTQAVEAWQQVMTLEPGNTEARDLLRMAGVPVEGDATPAVSPGATTLST